jgi:hypothetical protein
VNAPCADESRRPVRRAYAIDTNDAVRARRVNELIAAHHDPDVRCAGAERIEEHQIARLDRVG